MTQSRPQALRKRLLSILGRATLLPLHEVKIRSLQTRCAMDRVAFDRWVKRGVERYNNEPRWKRAIGNFGFGFIFIGALANLAVFMFVTTTTIGTAVMYQPWWPTYLGISVLTSWYWAARVVTRPAADA